MDDREETVDSSTREDGLNLTNGRCLYVGIKFVREAYKHNPKRPRDLNGLVQGGYPGIDIVSCGYNREDVVLSDRMKAYWFTFDRTDRARIVELTQFKGYDTPEFWVKQKFAVVSCPHIVSYVRLR